MILEIQVLPSPAGTDTNHYAHVDAAIAVIADSGLSYEVGAMGTVVEGSSDELWALARQVHDATLTSGAERVMTMLKIAEHPHSEVTIAGLVAPHRNTRR